METSKRLLDSDKDLLQVTYQVLSTRRQSYDNLMWQVPTLSLTAQAFLFTTALGNGSSIDARLISSILALVLSLMSLQLMAKHRFHEEIDSRLIEKLEEYLKLEIFMIHPHESIKNRANAVGLKPRGFVKLSSYRIWMIGLSLFAFTSVAIIILTLLHVIANLQFLS